MKVILILAIVLIGAATALAYGASVTAGVTMVVAHASRTPEPARLLLSGSLRLGIAGAVRRLPLQ